VAGLNQLLVLTSVAGRPSLASGPQLDRLSVALPVVVDPWPGEGVWMEAVVEDVDGTLYGYYHNENSATVCPGSGKVIPRIGAARSDDHGLTWTSLGLVLEAPPGSFDCETNDMYFVGGVGDSACSSMRTRAISTSSSRSTADDRRVSASRGWRGPTATTPSGKAMVFAGGVWLAARAFTFPSGMVRVLYPSAIPIFPPGNPGTTMTPKWTRSGDPPCTGTSTSNST
jgi:hypothetical protein